MKKHQSYDIAPDKPFFKKKSKSTEKQSSSIASPKKRIELRSECMDQLADQAVISEDQYRDLQRKILKDSCNLRLSCSCG